MSPGELAQRNAVYDVTERLERIFRLRDVHDLAHIHDGAPVADVLDSSHSKVVSFVVLILIASHGGRP